MLRPAGNLPCTAETLYTYLTNGGYFMKESDLRNLLKRPQLDSFMDRRIAEGILNYNINQANNRQRARVIYNKFFGNFAAQFIAVTAAIAVLAIIGGSVGWFSQKKEELFEDSRMEPASSGSSGIDNYLSDEKLITENTLPLFDAGKIAAEAAMLGNSHGNKANKGLFCEHDGWIYYSNFNNKGYLCRMRPDGSDKQVLLEEKCEYINVMNNYLYFLGEDGRIKRCRPDGSELVSLTDKYAGEILVTSEYIYYISASIEKIDLDGSNHESITKEGTYFNIDICGDYIFYTELSDDFNIYAVKTDGSRQYLVKEKAREGVILGEYLYYIDMATNRYRRYNLTTGMTETDGYGQAPHLVDDALYTNAKSGVYIYDEGNMALIKAYDYENDIVQNFYVAGDKIFVIIEDWHERQFVREIFLAEINAKTGELIKVE